MLRLLTKEGREARRANKAYEKCYEYRQEKLFSFRQNLIKDILFKYPDAAILINAFEKRFMVLLPSQNKLLSGFFADTFFPRLDYCESMASAHEKSSAITKFQGELNHCYGNISAQFIPVVEKFGRSWLLDDYLDESLKTVGYTIGVETELWEIMGGSVFLNNELIAKSSVIDAHHKPKGYINSAIYDKVVKDFDRLPGTQVLTFVLSAWDGGHSYQLQYEILFDKTIHQFNENNPNEFTQSIFNLRNFIHVIEDYCCLDAPGSNKSERENMNEVFNESDFDSIEEDDREFSHLGRILPYGAKLPT